MEGSLLGEKDKPTEMVHVPVSKVQNEVRGLRRAVRAARQGNPCR